MTCGHCHICECQAERLKALAEHEIGKLDLNGIREKKRKAQADLDALRKEIEELRDDFSRASEIASKWCRQVEH